MWKPWWDFWVRLSGELASLRGSSKRLFVALYRLLVRSKSPVRKCERRLGLESLEYRKYLSAVVNIQPLIVNAGDVGELTITVSGAITAPATIDYDVADGTAIPRYGLLHAPNGTDRPPAGRDDPQARPGDHGSRFCRGGEQIVYGLHP